MNFTKTDSIAPKIWTKPAIIAFARSTKKKMQTFVTFLCKKWKYPLDNEMCSAKGSVKIKYFNKVSHMSQLLLISLYFAKDGSVFSISCDGKEMPAPASVHCEGLEKNIPFL